MATSTVNPIEVKHLIHNAVEPVVFRKFLDWDLVKWSLEDWRQLLKDEELIFRCGKNTFTKDPQWERTTSQKKANFKDFMSFIKSSSSHTEWMYFDYKYLKDWFKNIEQLKNNISWEKFGFPEISHEDSTIWIGSQGAHTSCHIDSYGCNLVAQIYGRKQWVMFPPNENLKPTRIPYEESSIYSKLNFFSPTLQDFEHLGVESRCRKLVLEPGDVLFLPHKWWHYVENLEPAISINVWLPLPEDDQERLEEGLVQLFIGEISKNVSQELRNILLNPNSDKDVGETTFDMSLDLIEKSRELCNLNSFKRKQHLKNKCEGITDEVYNLTDLFVKYDFIQKIPVLSSKEFAEFLEIQRNKIKHFEVVDNSRNSNEFKVISDLVESMTHPDVIALIKEKLLSR